MDKIEIEIDEYGDDQLNGINIPATQEEFEDRVKNVVQRRFPKAEIIINRTQSGRGCRAWVNDKEPSLYGDTDEANADLVIALIDYVNEDFSEWAVPLDE